MTSNQRAELHAIGEEFIKASAINTMERIQHLNDFCDPVVVGGPVMVLERSLNYTAPVTADPTKRSNNEEVIKKKRVKVGGDNDLIGRKQLKIKNPKQRLDAIIDIDKQIQYDESKPNLKLLTLDAKNFYHKSIVPVLKCLENCHSGSKESFLRKWGAFAYSRFNESPTNFDFQCGKNVACEFCCASCEFSIRAYYQSNMY